MHEKVKETARDMLECIGRLRDYGIGLDAMPPELLQARLLLHRILADD